MNKNPTPAELLVMLAKHSIQFASFKDSASDKAILNLYEIYCYASRLSMESSPLDNVQYGIIVDACNHIKAEDMDDDLCWDRLYRKANI